MFNTCMVVHGNSGTHSHKDTHANMSLAWKLFDFRLKEKKSLGGEIRTKSETK